MSTGEERSRWHQLAASDAACGREVGPEAATWEGERAVRRGRAHTWEPAPATRGRRVESLMMPPWAVGKRRGGRNHGNAGRAAT